MSRRRLPRPAWAALITILLVAAPLGQGADPTRIRFDTVSPGSLPPGFRTLSSSSSVPGRWQVERVDGIAALGQLATGDGGYQLAVAEAPLLEHLRAGVRVRMGAGDRAAGLAWRVQDAGNYFAARLDLEERELVVYKFVRGNRVGLSDLSNLRIDETAWHEIAIEHVGDRLRVWLNGIPVASERDRSLSAPGMFGLWTPSDSSAYFADLWYEPVARN
jgi:hypothetical protein